MNINKDVPTPYAVQLEPVEGCSLACSFCGIQSIRVNGADADLGIHGKNSAPYRFMELETLEKFVREAAVAGWNPRWEFAMHGDPSIHPKLTEMIALVRKHHPKGYIMVTTNGSGLLKDTTVKIAAWFKAGLNTLALDDYKHSSTNGKPTWVTQIRNAIADDVLGEKNYDVHEYPKDPEGNPHHRHRKAKLVFIHDISENTTGNHTLTNQGGASFSKLKGNLEERCAKPFRELSIRWDGNVAICCDDWPGQYKIGNVNSLTPDEIWYHPRFEAARRKLYAADRNFGSCKGCDVKTARNGLLPDKLGKSEMAPVDDETRGYLRDALRGKVFTIQLAKGD